VSSIEGFNARLSIIKDVDELPDSPVATDLMWCASIAYQLMDGTTLDRITARAINCAVSHCVGLLKKEPTP
jgi:hypothetical protein